MDRKLRLLLAATAALVAGCEPSIVSAKIVNGHFEDGNTGFSSSYDSVAPPCGPGQYIVASNPANVTCDSTWASFGDHTTHYGLMMIIDGASEPGVVFWSETVKVRPATKYTLYFWAASAESTGQSNRTQIQAYVNDMPVGDALILPYTYNGWHEGTATWTTGPAQKKATITFVDLDTIATGNDFAFDDVKLRLVR